VSALGSAGQAWADEELEGDLGEQRVSPLELFFDLVFVFALTQVTAFLVHDQATFSAMDRCS